jgi:hypothetical protein
MISNRDPILFYISNMVWSWLSTPTIASNTENGEQRIPQYNYNQSSDDKIRVKYISPKVHHYCHDGG